MADFMNLPADEKEIAKQYLLNFLQSDSGTSSSKNKSPVESDVEIVAQSVIPIKSDGKTKCFAKITTSIDPEPAAIGTNTADVGSAADGITLDDDKKSSDKDVFVTKDIPVIENTVTKDTMLEEAGIKPSTKEITPTEAIDFVDLKATTKVELQTEQVSDAENSSEYEDDDNDDDDEDEEDEEDEETDDEDIEYLYEETDSDDALMEEDMLIMNDYIENIELEDGEDLNDLLAWSAMQDNNLEIELQSSDDDDEDVYDYASLDKVSTERELNDFEEDEAAILKPAKKQNVVEKKPFKKTSYKSNVNDTVVDPEIFGQTLKAALADVPPGLRPGMRRWYEKQQRKEDRLKKKEETKAHKREAKKKNKGKGKDEPEEGFETQMARIDE